MIAWTTAKNNASDIDNWTTVTLASTLDIDGVYGEVTDIVAHDEMLYAFQERGITQVMFNSRVAISTSDNTPIEISNNYKVDGNKYISTSVGCSNKFAVAKSPNGVYFIDDVGNSLYLLKGTQLSNISATKGFDYWFSQKDCKSEWRPMYWNNSAEAWSGGKGSALYYDNNKKDLYINTPEETLCFSELLDQFVSFYNYQGGVLFNVGSTLQALTNKTEKETDTELWNMFAGIHGSYLYDKYQSDLTFISNTDNTLDKTFTNLETRADFYDEENNLQHDRFFDTIHVWDEYQDTTESKLVYKRLPNQNTQKKFRIWRCEIPRAWKNGKRSQDRIRNTWCKIKLSMNTDKEKEPLHMEMHDVQAIYYV